MNRVKLTNLLPSVAKKHVNDFLEANREILKRRVYDSSGRRIDFINAAMEHFELDDSISACDDQRTIKLMVRECVEAFLQRKDVADEICEWGKEWREKQLAKRNNKSL
jgi:hypothetical protein